MVLYICLVIAALVALLLLVVATRPAAFAVRRSLLIDAPPERVYAQVADLKAWAAWSPWEKRDPGMQRTYGAVPAGVGATYHWRGNRQVGEGRMTITEARPGEHLGFDLEFITPFTARNRATFDFARSGAGTTVTWTMSGCNGFMGKAMGLVMDMDRLIGGDFAQGLAQLKAVAEAARG